MARRGENIRRRSDGRWEGRYIVSTDTGRKIKSIYAQTYVEVKERLTLERAQAGLPTPYLPALTESPAGTDSVYRFGDVAAQWLGFIKKERKYSTYVKYEGIYSKYLMTLAEKPTDSIDGGAVESCPGMHEKNDDQKRAVYAEVNRILRYARDNYGSKAGFLVADGKAAVQKKAVDTFNQTEQAKLLRFLGESPDICKVGIILCLSTGLRLGEVCSLKWVDIDTEMKVLHVNSTVQRIRTEGRTTRTALLETEPKSIYSRREIPLSDYMVELLRSFDKKKKYFLCGTKPMEPRSYQNKLKKYLKQAGVPEKNFHALRHTFATNCVNAGTDIKSLSEILGHADVQITLNRYVHPSIDTKRQHMNSLSAIYGQIMGQGV